MTRETTSEKRKGEPVARRAVLWMVGAVMCAVPLPLIIWAGVRSMSPFFLVAVWYATRTVVQALLRQAQERRRSQRDKQLVEATVSEQGFKRLAIVRDLYKIERKYLWMAVACKSNWPLFALAVTLVEPVVVAVIHEFWPLAFGLLTLTGSWRERMPNGTSRNTEGIAPMLLLLVIGGFGVSFAVLSDKGVTGWSSTSLLGLLVALLSFCLTAVGAGFEQLMGGDQRDNDRQGGSRSTNANETSLSASGNAAAQAIAAPVIALVGVLVLINSSSDGWSLNGTLFAIAAGATFAVSDWCWQHANHLSRGIHGQRGAQINSLYYLTPVGSLLLLVLFADTTIERLDLLVVGAAGVVVVNMILHLDPEGTQHRTDQSGGHGYRAFVLALWAAGTAVLLRDDWVPDSWEVWSVVEYWGMIGVCATVFILILSFRQSRLAERRRDMDALMLRLHRRLILMGRQDDMPVPKVDEANRLLRTVDTARRPSDLSAAYFKLRQLLIVEIAKETDREQIERLSYILADVELLVNLRQQGRNFSELGVLSLFGALTVTLSVAARPIAGAEPFAAWVHDTTSLVIAAAFTFLAFDLMDKRRDADAPTLRSVSSNFRKEEKQPPGWRLELAAYYDNTVERVAAALMGALLLIGAVAMLGVKWL